MTVQSPLFELVPDEPAVRTLQVPALEVSQGNGRTLYSFAIEGKDLPTIASISRLQQDDESGIKGYQRPEVLTHIAQIRRYIESEAPMIPNALVIAFDKRVTFAPLVDAPRTSYACPGMLSIPLPDDPSDDDKPGWIVDGQQRSAAIREARVSSFPICVTAFIADSDEEQRSQFILVNSAKPLPKGLIYELLPATTGTLPVSLQLRKFPSLLLRRLNREVRSPLYKMIRTPTTPDGKIKDNSILKMIENSLSDGALYRFRNPETGEGDEDAMMELLVDFWFAVSETFPEAWGKTTRQSRLMHGIGVISMGFLMDAIYDRYSRERVPTRADFREDLQELTGVCRWTAGYWDFGPGEQRKWNELQNVSRDIQLITSYLLYQYKTLVWNKGKR